MTKENLPILLVEDNPDDVILIHRAFHKANLTHPIQVVGHGDEAVAYLAGQGVYADRERYPLPVLIVLNLKMPRKSGLEVLAWLRQQPELKRLPVIVLTCSTEPADINHAYDLGANSYLVKAVAFDALVELVKAFGQYWLTYNVDPELD